MHSHLILDSVSISKGGENILDVSAKIAPGEVLSIMGPSGSGKSTLLNFILGNLDPAFSATGRVLLGETEITNLPNFRREIGLLFQDDLLFPHLSVGANLGFGLASGGTRAERRHIISEALASVGLDDHFDRDPATLSGGQKSRVALMRTLLADPKALLLDEPFSRLDADLRGQVRALVFQHAKAKNLPVLMVTHDKEDATAANGGIIYLGQ